MIHVGSFEHKQVGDYLFQIGRRPEVGTVLFRHEQLLVGEYDFVPDGGLLSPSRRGLYRTYLCQIEDAWLYDGVVFDNEYEIWRA